MKFIRSEYIKERLIEVARSLKTVTIEGETLIFGGLLKSGHPEDSFGILVRTEDAAVFHAMHYTRAEEFKQIWEEASLWEEYWGLSTEELEYAMHIRDAELVDPCHFCGSTEPLINGDDVHFGYVGYSVCPQCKAC